MSSSPKRARPRKSAEAASAPVITHAEQMETLYAREQGKTMMYKHDAWGHMETRFVRTQNVKVWEAKGFLVH